MNKSTPAGKLVSWPGDTSLLCLHAMAVDDVISAEMQCGSGQ